MKLPFSYAIGSIKAAELTTSEHCEVKKLCCYASANVRIYERIFYNNIILHSVTYQNGQGKRKSTYCSYKINQGHEMLSVLH